MITNDHINNLLFFIWKIKFSFGKSNFSLFIFIYLQSNGPEIFPYADLNSLKSFSVDLNSL